MIRSTPLAVHRELVEIAEDQLGLITLGQAVRAGVHADGVRRRVTAGLLVRVFAGVYRLVGLKPTADQTSLAACLAVPKSSIRGLSAAEIHGLPIGNRQLLRPSIVVAFDRHITVAGLHVHRTRHMPPTQLWKTGSITTVPATIVDLAGLVHADTLARCLDHTLANRTATVASVAKIVHQRPSARFPGRQALVHAQRISIYRTITRFA